MNDDDWENLDQVISGIEWCAGKKAVTQGIWMLNEPMILTLNDNRKVRELGFFAWSH